MNRISGLKLSTLSASRLGGSLALPMCAACLLALGITALAWADEASEREGRLAEATRYLASDELEGRGPGTHGIDLAAEYIAGEFRRVGLKTDLFDGTPFQKFTMTIGAELGSANEIAIAGPPDANAGDGSLALKLNDDFTPLAIGGSGKLDLPLVFVGYGITAKKEQYDDYAGIDVRGKAVVVVRKEPQQDNPHSVFDGTQHSQYAPFARKVANAYEHGAAAVIFCNDHFEIEQKIAAAARRREELTAELAAAREKFAGIGEPTAEQTEQHRQQMHDLETQFATTDQTAAGKYDPVLDFNGAGADESSREFPVLFVRRGVVDQMLKTAAGTDLAAIEEQIDQGPAPHSLELTGWRITGQVEVERTEAEVKNVVGVLEGEGPLADETVVVGAHYDHLGWGGAGSITPDVREIHNGADDNASGTAALIEVARLLANRGEKPRRRLVFLAFTGEERGLLGSAHYLRKPLVPPEQTVAMVNMDMVGRLNDDKLIIQGTDTATEFAPLVDRLNEKYGFKITKQPGGFGPSDHASFYGKQIPVMHFFTGTHSEYHRPSDDFPLINVSGMRKVTELVAETAWELAQADQRPHYLESETPAFAGGGGDRPYFGSIPDFAQDQPGYALTGVTKGGPAERAGLRAGDIIVQLGESRVGSLADFDSALRKFSAGDRAPVVVRRGNEELTFEVTLEPPR